MTDFIEIIKKNSKVQNDISLIIEKNNEYSYATQSKIERIALIQSKVFTQSIQIMGETIGEMDVESEQKHKK